LPHGPQPGKIEESIGTKETSEYAVMVDTFKPLNITTAAQDVDDIDYPASWLES
jgi:homogentisate 1,2-dioxygenase